MAFTFFMVRWIPVREMRRGDEEGFPQRRVFRVRRVFRLRSIVVLLGYVGFCSAVCVLARSTREEVGFPAEAHQEVGFPQEGGFPQ